MPADAVDKEQGDEEGADEVLGVLVAHRREPREQHHSEEGRDHRQPAPDRHAPCETRDHQGDERLARCLLGQQEDDDPEEDDDFIDEDFGLDDFDYWRGTIGVTFRFGG